MSVFKVEQGVKLLNLMKQKFRCHLKNGKRVHVF